MKSPPAPPSPKYSTDSAPYPPTPAPHRRNSPARLRAGHFTAADFGIHNTVHIGIFSAGQQPGAPGADYGWAYNDLRGITAKTIVLTPQHIRQIARLRLAYKRRDDHFALVSQALNPGDPFPPHEANALDDMTADIVDLVGDLMEALGYPL
jgi:hypothetical protein